MKKEHWLVVAAMLGALSVQLVGVQHGWVDVLTPSFIGGMLGSIATTLTALFMEPPNRGKEN